MVERAQASKVGGNGERTTATTVGGDWDPISILGNKRANGDDDIWFSCYGFSSLCPSVKFVACCVTTGYFVEDSMSVCQWQTQVDPLQAECSLAQKSPSHGINTSFEKLP